MAIVKGKREHWGSQLGFILAASGAAVGLGNIQRFPYVVSEHGGAAFLLVYIFCVCLIGVPMILVEFAIGRSALRNPSAALYKLSGGSKLWSAAGFLSILTAFFILSYYIVVAGWTLAYTVQYTYTKTPMPLSDLTSSPLLVIGATLVFQSLNMWIVRSGIKQGIERYSKVLLPFLFLLLISLVIRALTLPGSWDGLTFYLEPDFSELSIRAIPLALGQAFFSLSLGEAVLVTYASFTEKKEDLFFSGLSIAGFDTLVAILAGLLVFPTLFAFGYSPKSQGSGLLFNVMPDLIAGISYGQLFGLAFFLLLSFAALTTCIALFEICVTYISERFNLARSRAIWLVGGLSALLSVPVALSHGASDFLTNLYLFGNQGLYNIVDFLWGGIAMVLNGLLLAIFVGWVWGPKKASREIISGSNAFARIASPWEFHVKYIIPGFILLILLGLFWD